VVLHEFDFGKELLQIDSVGFYGRRVDEVQHLGFELCDFGQAVYHEVHGLFFLKIGH
jgi:hypothetical protein